MITRIATVVLAVLLLLWILNGAHFAHVQHAFNHVMDQLTSAVG